MNTILITGGSGKIGYQLVNHYLSLDYLVIATTRDKNRFYSEKINSLNVNHQSLLKLVEVDFTQVEAVTAIIDFLREEGIFVNSIIHNARSIEYLAIGEKNVVSAENFSGEFFIDVVFPYQLTMRIVNEGFHKLQNVLFISSIYGVVAPTPSLYEDFHKSSPIHYGVAKAAQIHLTKELAVRLAPEIRVNCISLGGIKGRSDATFVNRYEKLNPQNKMMEEVEVVDPIHFLMSDKSKNMTGQNIIVDGGWTLW